MNEKDNRGDQAQTGIEDGNTFTVREWEQKTIGWIPMYLTIAQAALAQHPLVRSNQAKELIQTTQAEGFNPELINPTYMTADIYNLNDKALKNLITALENNDKAGLLHQPKKRVGFLSRLRNLRK